MKRVLSLLILLVLTTSGCTLYHVSSEDSADNFYPSKTSINDIAYLETITQPHEVIGSVVVNAERRQYISEVVDKMKREAAILGGDAITKIQSDATGEWKKLPVQELLGNAYIRANFRATVVVLK